MNESVAVRERDTIQQTLKREKWREKRGQPSFFAHLRDDGCNTGEKGPQERTHGPEREPLSAGVPAPFTIRTQTTWGEIVASALEADLNVDIERESGKEKARAAFFPSHVEANREETGGGRGARARLVDNGKR